MTMLKIISCNITIDCGSGQFLLDHVFWMEFFFASYVFVNDTVRPSFWLPSKWKIAEQKKIKNFPHSRVLDRILHIC